MAIKEVLMLGNPLLRKKSFFIQNFKEDVTEIVKDLSDTLTDLQKKKNKGRALAAPQIGYLKKIIFMQISSRTIVMINPQIVWKSEELFDVWDDCFSFDMAFFVKIKRHKQIKVQYQDETGKAIIETFTDDLSELFQHEIDHLEGILATDHLTDVKNIIMKSELEKMKEKDE